MFDSLNEDSNTYFDCILTVTVCSFPSLSVTFVVTGVISLSNAPVCWALPALSTFCMKTNYKYCIPGIKQ